MAIATKVIGIRYGVRTPEHEDGPGTDGFAVLQEVNGKRHAVILFFNAVGTEMLDLMHRLPGEPVFAHEFFVDLLRLAGTTIDQLTFTQHQDAERRPGTVTVTNANGSVRRECGAFDVVGLSIATKVPILIEDALFDDMHENSPDLEWIMRDGDDTNRAKEMERQALSPDIKKSHMH